MKRYAVVAFLGLLAPFICFAQSEPAPAHLHVYRPQNKIFGNGMSPTLACGPNVIAKVTHGSFFDVDLAPGKCFMRAAYSMYFDEHPMVLESGKDYYVRLTLVGDSKHVLMMYNSFRLELNDMPEADAKEAMKNLKQLPANKVTVVKTGTD